MRDFAIHLLLFVAVCVPIVALGAMYSEMDDRAALKLFPKRFAWFTFGCAIVAVVLVVLEHTLASAT